MTERIVTIQLTEEEAAVYTNAASLYAMVWTCKIVSSEDTILWERAVRTCDITSTGRDAHCLVSGIGRCGTARPLRSELPVPRRSLTPCI